tara:strand:- start:1783 stop:2181 length:399 start_codon:yes stop_codon:yes gene_type:complete
MESGSITMSDNQDEVAAIVQAALGELLNIATQVAELQGTDESADEIYNICDLVAEYYQIERSRAICTEHDDGSFTTHFETFTGAGEPIQDAPRNDNKNREPIPGNLRFKGKPKLRLIDSSTPIDYDDEPPED